MTTEEGKFRISVVGNVAVMIFILGGVWWIRGTIDELVDVNRELRLQVLHLEEVLKEQALSMVRFSSTVDDLSRRMSAEENRQTGNEGKMDAVMSLMRKPSTMPTPP